uniref:Uncharacterized protein n=1 Tax=Encephalitozoon cuniculi TaxID=6035 RepID=M1JJ05_ENCCN|nr:hypothetical protein ECU05_0140 [Encephalitozoon cuniculi]
MQAISSSTLKGKVYTPIPPSESVFVYISLFLLQIFKNSRLELVLRLLKKHCIRRPIGRTCTPLSFCVPFHRQTSEKKNKRKFGIADLPLLLFQKGDRLSLHNKENLRINLAVSKFLKKYIISQNYKYPKNPMSIMKSKIAKTLVVVVVAIAIFTLVLLMLWEGPLGTLTEENLTELNGEVPFRFKDSGSNEEGKDVTLSKFFVCLNKVLRSADDSLSSYLCCGETSEEEGKSKKGKYVKNAITEARNMMFRVKDSKDVILEILKKGDKNSNELAETVSNAFSAVETSEGSDQESEGADEQGKIEKLNTALAELYIWIWLKGIPEEDKRTLQFRKTYKENQSVKNLLDGLDEENREVAESTILVKVGKKEDSMHVIEHILTSIFQANGYMERGSIKQVYLSAKASVAAAGGSLGKKVSEVSDNEGKGLIDSFLGMIGWRDNSSNNNSVSKKKEEQGVNS